MQSNDLLYIRGGEHFMIYTILLATCTDLLCRAAFSAQREVGVQKVSSPDRPTVPHCRATHSLTIH